MTFSADIKVSKFPIIGRCAGAPRARTKTTRHNLSKLQLRGSFATTADEGAKGREAEHGWGTRRRVVVTKTDLCFLRNKSVQNNWRICRSAESPNLPSRLQGESIKLVVVWADGRLWLIYLRKNLIMLNDYKSLTFASERNWVFNWKVFEPYCLNALLVLWLFHADDSPRIRS